MPLLDEILATQCAQQIVELLVGQHGLQRWHSFDCQFADGAERAGEERQPNSFGGETEVGAVDLEHEQRREDGDDEVSDTHKKERLVAAIDRIAHGHLAAVEIDAVEAPSCDGKESVD